MIQSSAESTQGKVVFHEADLHVYPGNDVSSAPADLKDSAATHQREITLGDLHGNALKFLWGLIKTGVVTLKEGEADYNKFIQIYYKSVDELTADDIQNFQNIVNSMAIKKHTLVRLIGDELADRGSNDYFTLKILERLANRGCPYEIMLSNHSVGFIQKYEKRTLHNSNGCDFSTNASNSLFELTRLVQKNNSVSDEIYSLVQRYYMQNK